MRKAEEIVTRKAEEMSRMVMVWMFGVPLSVLVLMKVFGIL